MLALAPLLALSFAAPALGAEGFAGRLPLPPLAPAPADGRYLTDDQVRFMIDVEDDQIRLRFIDSEEIFYLRSEPAPLGGRMLKYDTGEVVLQVAGWGGLTLYTEEDRGGVPTELADDDIGTFEPEPVPPRDVKDFALRLSQDLAAASDFGIGFAADWDEIERFDGTRALAVDAMRNAAYALQKLAHGPERDAIAERFHLIRVMEAAEPGVRMQDGALIINYTPESGRSARPSSRAVARVLAQAFAR